MAVSSNSVGALLLRTLSSEAGDLLGRPRSTARVIGSAERGSELGDLQGTPRQR